MGHVVEENRFLPKNSCFLQFSMYCPVLNFIMQVFCESMMLGSF